MDIREEIARRLAEWRSGDHVEPWEVDMYMDAAAALTPLLNRVRAEAVEAFAAELRDRYSEDVFRPMADADHRSVNDALAGRVERTGVTRDRVSADMMRRAAAQASQYAAEFIELNSEGNET